MNTLHLDVIYVSVVLLLSIFFFVCCVYNESRIYIQHFPISLQRDILQAKAVGWKFQLVTKLGYSPMTIARSHSLCVRTTSFKEPMLSICIRSCYIHPLRTYGIDIMNYIFRALFGFENPRLLSSKSDRFIEIIHEICLPCIVWFW